MRTISLIFVIGAITSVFGLPAFADTIVFDDDFSAWTYTTFGAGSLVMGNDKSDSLKWDLTANAGSADRKNQFVYTHTGVVSTIEFDYRFKNDGHNSRLEFRLLDGADNELWNANPSSIDHTPPPPVSDTGGVSPVWKHVVIPNVNDPNGTIIDSDTVKFEYHQTIGSGAIKGKPGLFSVFQDDWDAEVDNVILSTCTERLATDINDDCEVNLEDYALLAGNWFKSSAP